MPTLTPIPQPTDRAVPRIAVHTLGCKLNYAETVTIQRDFLGKGFRVVEFTDEADVVLINTCSVTENADRECRKLVRQALRRSPTAFVVVVGCYAQLRPGEIASIPGVDLVLGSSEKFHLFDYVDGWKKQGATQVHVSCIDEVNDFSPAFSDDAGDRTRAFLKVQDGCDYTCAFCTIPLARGASRSQSIEATLTQAQRIRDEGFKEIVLSGVNVGDYGKNIGSSFFDLLRALVALEGDFRLRISSIEPNLLSDEIIDLVSQSEKISRHFHVPLQSGNNETLRLMRRRYNRELYRDRVEKIRSRIPNACIGIDVIVGHPGETEESFVDAYEYLVDVPFSYLHVFSYSERPGTHALTLEAQVSHAERARRSEMLRNLSVLKRRAFYESQIGQAVEVLFEQESETGLCVGFSDNYVRVGVRESSIEVNTMRRVQLERIEEGIVVGSLV